MNDFNDPILIPGAFNDRGEQMAITAESAIIMLTAELHALGKILLQLEARLASMEGCDGVNRDYEETRQ